MRKLFLISLMTLCTCVMAWGETRTAGTYAELQDAIAASAAGDVIELTADIAYPKNGEGLIDITKNITIDGKDHTLSGYGYLEAGAYPAIAINKASQSNETELTLKNLTISNPCKTAAYYCRVIQLEGHVKALTLDNVHIIAPNGSSRNARGIQIDGNDTGWDKKTKITIKNSSFNMGYSSYCITSYNPYELDAKNSRFDAWNVLTMKDVNSGAGHETAGSRGSVITFEACDIQTINPHTGKSNDYEIFSIQDDGITINLINCTTNAVQLKDQSQYVFDLNGWQMYPERREQPVVITISGDNSNIQGKLTNNEWAQGICYRRTPEQSDDYLPKPGFAYTITIKGGTYGFDPESYDEVVIPAGYEVKEITTQQGDKTTTLWRVREEITEEVNINTDETEGKDIKVDESVKLEKEETVAEYIEVKGGEGSDPAETVTVTVPEGKSLEVTNGLDVTGNAEVVVEAGSTVVVGEGGIISEKPENIVIEANENGAASLILDPAVIINTTPNLSVKMKAHIGKDGSDYVWHRYAMPVAEMKTMWEKDKDIPTYIEAWDYTAPGGGAWKSIAVTDMEPFYGYTITTDADVQDIVYTFKGNLAGNQNSTLDFTHQGYNFFGNSYTGYIDITALVSQLVGDIDGSVWMWDQNNQTYKGVGLQTLVAHPEWYPAWQKEVAPMQTFILRLMTEATDVVAEVNYEEAIWKNPRYGKAPAGAPARRETRDESSFMRIVVTAANGASDEMEFVKANTFSDSFEHGADVAKYTNANALNVFATVEGENYSTVASDNLEGKSFSIMTLNDVNYTFTFENVVGEEFAIRDNVTGQVIAIEEGAVYEFAAQPNSVIEGRFEIVSRANAPTAIENTDVKANVKGIYTIMGQYLGEDFDVLPTGIYVVNGVKIVK